MRREISISLAHSRVSNHSLANAAAFLSIRTHVLAVWIRGDRKVWNLQGWPFGDLASMSVQSVGKGWIRPNSMTRRADFGIERVWKDRVVGRGGDIRRMVLKTRILRRCIGLAFCAPCPNV